MRVGLISPPWVPVPPPGYGATEAMVDVLARGVVAAGHDVLLIVHDHTMLGPERAPNRRGRQGGHGSQWSP